MSISWTDLTNTTETVGDLALKTKTSIATVSGGYLARVLQEVIYKGSVPVMPKVVTEFIPATAPVSLSASEVSTATASYTLTGTGGDPDTTFDLIDKTQALTPLNGSSAPIGTTQIYLSTRIVRPNSTGVSASIDLSLTYVP